MNTIVFGSRSIFLLLITVLVSCVNDQQSNKYTDQFVSNYFEDEMQGAEECASDVLGKYEKLINKISSIEYVELDTTNKLIVSVPVFGGYSDSCRYDEDYLVTYFTLYDLDTTIHHQFKEHYNPIGYELRNLLKVARQVNDNNYPELSGSNKAKVEKITKDLHNLKVLRESKYLFILEIVEYRELPYRPYAKSSEASSAKASWHVFDFSELSYLGSIPFEADNDGFRPLNTKTFTQTKHVTKRIIRPYTPSDHTVYLYETETVKETHSVRTSYEDKVNQAEYSFREKFTEAARRSIQEFVLSSNEKFRDYVNLK
ncbi:MAG: hypothetical protein AB8B56_18740 [Crocinitomicaceae bacterium]